MERDESTSALGIGDRPKPLERLPADEVRRLPPRYGEPESGGEWVVERTHVVAP